MCDTQYAHIIFSLHVFPMRLHHLNKFALTPCLILVVKYTESVYTHRLLLPEERYMTSVGVIITCTMLGMRTKELLLCS